MKRVIDLILATVALVLLSPFLAIIAFIIKQDSSGPAFFMQQRLGKNLNPFLIIKFRTMVVNAEGIGTGIFNYADDPRVTRIGRFLRRTSIDELPQLINIIRGEMSIVGPRPPLTYELGDPEGFRGDLLKRFAVRPGVTGLAQVSGRNTLSWEEKIKFDIQYLEEFEKWGTLLDLKIIFLTIKKVLLMEDSFELKENQEKDSSRMTSPKQEFKK